MTTFLVMLLGLQSFSLAAAPRSDEPISVILAPAIKEPAKVNLGKHLFFDPRLSRSGFISCNSCHNLSTGGADNLTSSIGHKWNIGPINSPTVLNSVYNLAQFWDGRAKDLTEQAGGPIANPGEMGASNHDASLAVLKSIPGYSPMFKEAFGSPEITIHKVQVAIAAFEETLVTPDSRFDKWLAGDDKALSSEELQGYQSFKEKGCIGCHNGPAVGGTSFQKMGLVKPYKTKSKALGRYAVTKKPEDKFVFKVPVLRNIELTAPYFHDASAWSLREAIQVMATHQLGVKLTDVEVKNIEAFLRTLTGKQPEVTIPILPASAPDTPRPNFR